MSELSPIQSALCVAKCKATNLVEHAASAYWMRGSDNYTADYLVNQCLEDFEELSAQIEVIRAAMAGKQAEEAA